MNIDTYKILKEVNIGSCKCLLSVIVIDSINNDFLMKTY